VDQCLARIERDVRVDTVENVERTGAGWQVSGTLFNGTPFQCRIGNNGQIDDVDYSGFSGAALGGQQTQWSDQRYADARLRIGQPAPVAATQDQPLPAYPGGPIPGEAIPETVDGEV
jgi:hypothetical protein